jgi:hypothetical protein
LSGNVKGRHHFEDINVGVNIILKGMLKEWVGMVLTRFICHGLGKSGALLNAVMSIMVS